MMKTSQVSNFPFSLDTVIYIAVNKNTTEAALVSRIENNWENKLLQICSNVKETSATLLAVWPDGPKHIFIVDDVDALVEAFVSE